MFHVSIYCIFVMIMITVTFVENVPSMLKAYSL